MDALSEEEQTQHNQGVDLAALDEIRAGFKSVPKHISSRYFYDEHGSRLFDQITHLPEYYPTRTEVALLTRSAGEIAKITGQGMVILEPGAGNCAKVRHLLPALQPACYIPIDISREYLFAAADKLQQEYADIAVFPVPEDMQSDIQLPAVTEGIPRLVFYPGSTIGNYTPEQAVDFLRQVRRTIGDNGGLLIGVDLQKDTEILHRAYNDASGITAAFNLNCLNHINRITGSNFDLSQFNHLAFYNEEAARIEMHLESRIDQLVSLAGEVISLTAGERIRTEYSYKYTPKGFAELASEAGLTAQEYWIDDEGLFSLQYYRAV